MAEPAEAETQGQPLATLRLKIGGMSCSFCVTTITKAFKRMPGVEQVGVKRSLESVDGVTEVEVSLAHRHARVLYHRRHAGCTSHPLD